MDPQWDRLGSLVLLKHVSAADGRAYFGLGEVWGVSDEEAGALRVGWREPLKPGNVLVCECRV